MKISILFPAALLSLTTTGCILKRTSMEPEIQAKAEESFKKKLKIRMLQKNPNGTQEPQAIVRLDSGGVKNQFEQDPGSPWVVVQSRRSQEWPDRTSLGTKAYNLLSLATLLLVPAFSSSSEYCTYEVSYCGRSFENYQFELSEVQVGWLPLLPFVIWFIDDSLTASIGNRQANCDGSFSTKFLIDLQGRMNQLPACPSSTSH